MENWTGKPGYPVVKVSKVPKGLKFSQSRFFSSPISKVNSKDKTLWQIPVAVSDGQKPQKLLMGSKELEQNGKFNSVKVNPGESGFYRTHYSSQMLEELYPLVKNKKLTAIGPLRFNSRLICAFRSRRDFGYRCFEFNYRL